MKRKHRKEESLPEEIKDDVAVEYSLKRKASAEFRFQDTVDCSLRNTVVVP